MTIATTSQTVFDGHRQTVKQFTGISDGSGNLTYAMLVQANTLAPPAKAVKVAGIVGSVSYGVVELYWEASPANVKFAELSGDRIDFNYRKAGPLASNAFGATGNILISTLGFTAGSTYSLKIDMTKRYKDKVQVT